MASPIKTIIDKEWAEVFKNRMVLLTIVLLPLIFTALPIVFLYYTTQSGDLGSTADLPPAYAAACGAVSMADCMQTYILNEFLMLYMIMPLMIPITIAAYSIVGEKATRSLEPLLATPISTEELLAGKSLAAVIPAVLATWACFLIFAIALPIIGVSPAVISYALGPTWLVAIFIGGPLMAVFAVNIAVLVSSRARDPRAAEQTAAVVILPVLIMLFAVLAGFIVLNVTFMLASFSVLLILDVFLVYLGARLFQREAILTRWS
jgi:ABC-2 type transport system permease protein